MDDWEEASEKGILEEEEKGLEDRGSAGIEVDMEMEERHS